MVPRNPLGRTLAVLALLVAGPASAAQISLTGDAEKDFPAGQPRYGVFVDNPNKLTGASDMNDVAQAQWITDQGHVSGWNMKDIRLHYDAPSDTLAVGVNFFGVAGDADGDGDPGHTDPRTALAGGVDLSHLGGRESIAVALDLNNDKIPDIIAGVPADKSTAGPGINGFTVAKYKGDASGLSFAFGQTLKNQLGNLAFDPDAKHPDFEFTIKNFSKIPGFEFNKLPLGFEFSQGIGVQAFAGTPDDIIAGEDTIPYMSIKPEAIPEPATLLAWSVVALGAAWRLRHRRPTQA